MAGDKQRAWRCGVCGYVHVGAEAPDSCPVCGAAAVEFEVHTESVAFSVSAKADRWQCPNCNHAHEGEEPPADCPVCGASSEKFEAVPGYGVPTNSGAVRVMIVGGGVAAVSAAETIRRGSPDSEIVLVSSEPEVPYYRLNLTRYLAGELERAALPIHPLEWYAERGIELIPDATVERIDSGARLVALQDGRVFPYERLLLAMGSHPFVPPIEGVHRQGVFALRTVTDADAILTRAYAGARCVCIGGGVLGIEAVGALARQGTSIALLEGHDWLMPRQLNRTAAAYLERYMHAIGVEVIKNARAKAITGRDVVTGVALHDGRTLDADVVILATGVRPNTALARKAGLEVNNGIVVDNHLRTSFPDVYAAGDVAEHNGQVYGSWAAAQYQGGIAALNMLGVPAAFGGLPRANSVKALGLDLTSIGKFMPEDGSDLVLEQHEKTSYVSFVFRDGRMVGAILVGHVELAAAAKKAIESSAAFAGILQGTPTCADVIRALQKGAMG
jgi:nitrite reductase (NADH) large subunit